MHTAQTQCEITGHEVRVAPDVTPICCELSVKKKTKRESTCACSDNYKTIQSFSLQLDSLLSLL